MQKPDFKIQIEVCKRYGLFWANSWVEDAEMNFIAEGVSIFDPDRASNLFFDISSKLKQLNDFCFYQIASAHDIQNFFEEEVRRISNGNSISGEEALHIWKSHSVWSDILNENIKASPILLLSGFLEWSLKKICSEILGCVPKRKKRNVSLVQSLVESLRESKLSYWKPDRIALSVLEDMRKVRNKLAHGDQEEMAELLKGVKLGDYFDAVSRLIGEIEQHAWNSEWGQL